MESKLSQTTKENDAKRRKISSLTEEKENLLKDRGESEERTENLEKIKALEEERRALKAQLDEFQVFDPEAMQKKGLFFFKNFCLFGVSMNLPFFRKNGFSSERFYKPMDRQYFFNSVLLFQKVQH